MVFEYQKIFIKMQVSENNKIQLKRVEIPYAISCSIKEKNENIERYSNRGNGNRYSLVTIG